MAEAAELKVAMAAGVAMASAGLEVAPAAIPGELAELPEASEAEGAAAAVG